MIDVNKLAYTIVVKLMLEHGNRIDWKSQATIEKLLNEALSIDPESLQPIISGSCDHSMVTREYTSQPYGHCMLCGKTVFAE